MTKPTAETTADAKSNGLELEVSTSHTPALVRTSKSISELEKAIEHYPEMIRNEVRWVQGFFLEHCHNNTESLRAIAAKLGHDKSREYFRNLICGDYFTAKANTWNAGGRAWSEFLELASSLRRYEQQVQRTGQLPFVQTPTYRCISNFIDSKRAIGAVCRIGGIIAPTGGQTSESFKCYRTLNNHGQVIHVESPANGSLPALQGKILEAYHVGVTGISRRRELELRENINESRTIIIDNAQVLYQARHGAQQPCFNWLREIYDDRRPTIILKFTEEFLNDLSSGAAKGYFEQFIGRMGGLKSILRLPEYAPESDLRCIARTLKIEGKGALELMHKWSRQQGRIRIVFDKIQLAFTFAQDDGRDRVTLEDLRSADAFEPQSSGSDEEVES